MKSAKFLGLGLGLVCLTAATVGVLAGCSSCPSKGELEGVKVKLLIQEVERALDMAADQLASTAGPTPPHLNTVTLSLQTAVTRQVNGGFDIVVLQLGTQTTRTLTSKITLNLQPQFKGGRPHLAGMAPDLAGAVVAAWQAENDARNAVTSLYPTGVSCEISFGVQKQATGGLKLVVAPVTGTLGGAYSRETVQTISFSFQ